MKKNKESNAQKTIKKFYNVADLILQKKILSTDFSELLGLYFVCEKLARFIMDKQSVGVEHKESINLKTLRKSLKGIGIPLDEYTLNLIFNTSWHSKNKGQYSFRSIRNRVCHGCSIKERDYAVRYYKPYQSAMEQFFEQCCLKIAR